MIGLLLVGLVPFAALGILIGHLVTVDSVGPAMGGITALLSLLGGVWFPITGHGALHDIAQALPSYWLVQASHVAIGGHGVERARLDRDRDLDRRRRTPRGARVPARHRRAELLRWRAHRPRRVTRYHCAAMADQQELSLQDQLKEIGAQLDWVRGYL